MRQNLAVCIAVVLGACGDDAKTGSDTSEVEVAPDTDTTSPDAAPTDTAPTDTGPADTEPADTEPADTTDGDVTPSAVKHVLCHAPGDALPESITVAEDEVASHLDHGDQRGPCSPLTATLVPASDTVIDCDGRAIVPAADGPEVFLFLDGVERVHLTDCDIRFDFGAFMLGGGHHEIRANTFTAASEAVTVLDASDNVIADNVVRYGGLGIRIERDSDRNLVSGNDIAPEAIEVGADRPGLPEPHELVGAAAILVFDEPLPRFGLINAIIDGRLVQSAASVDGRPDDNVLRDNDVVAGDPVGIAVMTRSNRTLVAGNRVRGGDAFGMASFGFPEVSQILVPGTCSLDGARLCRDDADCELAGFDATPLGTCAGAVFADVDGRVAAPDYHDNVVAGAGAAAVFAYDTVGGVIRDNDLADSGVGIGLEGPSVAAITVTGNTVRNNGTGLRLVGGYGVSYGADVSGNDFVGNDVGIEAVNVKARVDGNYWGYESCPGFLDADRVGNAADCAPYVVSVASGSEASACPAASRPHALDGVCAFAAPEEVTASGGGHAEFEVALDYAGTYGVTASGLAAGVSFGGTLVAGEGTALRPIPIPPGSELLRVHLELAPEDLGKGHDLDLVLFDGDCAVVGWDTCPYVAPFMPSSDELIDVTVPSEAGYVIGVDPWFLDGEVAKYRLSWWVVPAEGDLLTVTAPATSAPDTTATVHAAWPEALAPGNYLATLHHQSAEADLGVTVLTLRVSGDRASVRVGIGNSVDSPEWLAWLGELARFTEVTGLTTELVHVDDWFALHAAPGEPAVDVLDVPQPAVIRALDALGHVRHLALSPESVVAAYGRGGLDLGTSDAGDILALPIGGSVKSLVWARKDTFAPPATPPTTWEALLALTAQLAADEGPPWALPFGDFDGFYTHWPATDWIEDLLLKSCGPIVYDEIFAGERPFADPCMKAAWEQFGSIARNEQYIAGGAAERGRWFPDVGGLARPTAMNDYIAEFVPDYPWTTAPAPARLHHQGSFFAYIVGPGGGFWNFEGGGGFIDQMTVFPMPAPIGSAYADAAVVSGDLMARVSDQPNGVAFLTWLMSADFGKSVAASGAIVANIHFDAYPPEQAFVAAQAAIFRGAMISGLGRFDGSDLLPPPVEKAFRDALVAYLDAPSPDLDALLAGIDASWPR